VAPSLSNIVPYRFSTEPIFYFFLLLRNRCTIFPLQFPDEPSQKIPAKYYQEPHQGDLKVRIMIRPEDAQKILTAHDLSMYLKDIVAKEDSDLKIDIDYESGELFINCPGFSNGLSVTTDTFGVWVINEAISQENDGVYTQSGNFHKTEKTITVLRAVASWIRDLEDSTRSF
jgi:hypothetical protein